MRSVPTNASLARLTICLVLLSVIIITVSAEDIPLIPCEFYGNATVNGQPAAAGSLIAASIGSEVRGSIVMTATGSYGGTGTFNKRLFVNATAADAGRTITFSVNGAPAAETATFQQGVVVRQNLTVILAGPDPVANFTVNSTTGNVPLTLQFNDTSNGFPISWVWNFGDAGSSTLQDPVHTYTTPGTYTVSLEIANASGMDTAVRINYITAFPKGDFNHNNRVDIGDVTSVAYMAVGLVPKDFAANFNGDTEVDAADAALIAYYYVGKIHGLGPEIPVG